MHMNREDIEKNLSELKIALEEAKLTVQELSIAIRQSKKLLSSFGPAMTPAGMKRKMFHDMIDATIERMNKEFPELPGGRFKWIDGRFVNQPRYGKRLSIEEKIRLQWLVKNGITKYWALAKGIDRQEAQVKKYIKSIGGLEEFCKLNFDTPSSSSSTS